jgi:hypothetical protein
VGSGHILYIPLILFLGVVIGFVLGRQAAVRESEGVARRLKEREARVARMKAELAGPEETERDG